MYRILSLDGFGAWSLIQIRALQDLYGRDARGREVLSEFDLVASHGSGSIVAAALAADWPLSRILGLFLDEAARRTLLAPSQPVGQWSGSGRSSSGRRYEALVALLHPLSDTLVKDLPEMIRNARGGPVHFLFVGWDASACEPLFIRTQSTSTGWSGPQPPRRKVAEAVYAACQLPSGAPTALRRSDGALCPLSNPILAAISEALANGVARESIEVLSLGTGNVSLPVSQGAHQTGPLFRTPIDMRVGLDGRPQPYALPDDPPDPSTYLAQVTLGLGPGGGRVVRLNPLIEAIVDPATGARYLPQFGTAGEASSMPDIAVFSGLVHLSGQAVESREIALICLLAEAWLQNRVRNQLLKAEEPGRLSCGQSWYAEAKAHWTLHLAPPPLPKVIEPPVRQVISSRPERTLIV